MENSKEFVEKIKEQQKKEADNKRRQGNGHPEKVLPNNKH